MGFDESTFGIDPPRRNIALGLDHGAHHGDGTGRARTPDDGRHKTLFHAAPDDTAQAKMDALRTCKVHVAESPADLGSTMADVLGVAVATA